MLRKSLENECTEQMFEYGSQLELPMLVSQITNISFIYIVLINCLFEN